MSMCMHNYVYVYVCVLTITNYDTHKAAAARFAKCLLHIQPTNFTLQLKSSHLSTIKVTLLWKLRHTPSYIRGEGEGEVSPIWAAAPWLDCRGGLLELTR